MNDKQGEAFTLVAIGTIYSNLGEKHKALELFNQALPLNTAVRNKIGEAATLNNIGIVYRVTNQPKQAIEYLELSAEITLKLRNDIARENRKTFLESERDTADALIDLLIEENQPEMS